MKRFRQGFTLWFTGLPCSGKSTLAGLVAEELQRRGAEVEVLDADAVRRHLCKDLGFSKADRDENIRRIGYVCRLLNRHGVVAIAAAISPYRATRDEVRASIQNFVEVFTNAPLETCMERDVKGMYKKALAGEIKNFTGVNDPYEPPLNPEITVETAKEAPGQSLTHILTQLERMGLVEPAPQPDYTPEEAERIRARLIQLGYIRP